MQTADLFEFFFDINHCLISGTQAKSDIEKLISNVYKNYGISDPGANEGGSTKL